MGFGKCSTGGIGAVCTPEVQIYQYAVRGLRTCGNLFIQPIHADASGSLSMSSLTPC